MGLFFLKTHIFDPKIRKKHLLDFQIQKKFLNGIVFQFYINENFSFVLNCFAMKYTAPSNLHQSAERRLFLCRILS